MDNRNELLKIEINEGDLAVIVSDDNKTEKYLIIGIDEDGFLDLKKITPPEKKLKLKFFKNAIN